MAAQVLEQLLAEAGLADAADKVGDSMYRIRWGSTTLVTGSVGDGIVVIAPMFDAPPASRQEPFYRRLLEINCEMGGTAALSLQQDGSVVLQVGRGVRGLDAHELGLMVGTIGRFAGEYGEKLRREFYGE